MLDKQTAKLIAVIAQNLPEMSTEVMQRYIDDPKGVQAILRKAFLTFPILMTVKLGTGLETAGDFRLALKNAKMDVYDWANSLMEDPDFQVANQLTEVSIVAPTLAELGFKTKARYADICRRGVELGFELCPPELGPQLRLQYLNQPKGEVLRMAMKPIRRSRWDLNIFRLEHGDSGMLLHGNGVEPYFVFDPSHRFVFVCRK